MGELLRKVKIDGEDFERNNEDTFDLNDLLHPAQAFSHPAEVVNDPDLTLNEKRAILASWASDACAVESVPELRRAPIKGGRPVAFDDVMDALRALDARAAETSSRYHRVRKRRLRRSGKAMIVEVGHEFLDFSGQAQQACCYSSR
jgi:SpoU rRNA methylase family enzyme